MELKEHLFDFDAALRPVWNDGGVAWSETVLPMEDKNGVVRIPLYYRCDEVIEIRSADLKRVYEQGKDYTVENGEIVVPIGSSIPTLSYARQYPESETDRCFRGRNGVPFILFGEGTMFHRLQLNVTYRHSDGWRGPVPERGTTLLPRLTENLRSRKGFRMLVYGDSIPAGGNASGRTGIEPYLPAFGELFAENLQRITGTEIDEINTAVGGWTSEDGIKAAEERVAAYAPDLMVLHFGMNDGSGHFSPEKFTGLLRDIIAVGRAKNPDMEVILVSCISANPEACLFGLQLEYPPYLQAMQEPGIAFANMTQMHLELLNKKRYMDMTGNNVNHPNDYLHRLYAQILTELVLPR